MNRRRRKFRHFGALPGTNGGTTQHLIIFGTPWPAKKRKTPLCFAGIRPEGDLTLLYCIPLMHQEQTRATQSTSDLHRPEVIYSSCHTWDLFIIIDRRPGGEMGFIHQTRSSTTNVIALKNIEIHRAAG